MRSRAAVLVLLVGVASVCADAPAARHGIAADLKSFPQANPKEALTSILKAADAKRFDYLLAQLADPDWVDARAGAGFKELVQETTMQLDSPRLKLLRRFLDLGEVETLDNTAVFRLKDVKDRVVRLRKQNGRWYLRHSNKP